MPEPLPTPFLYYHLLNTLCFNTLSQTVRYLHATVDASELPLIAAEVALEHVGAVRMPLSDLKLYPNRKVFFNSFSLLGAAK